MVKLVIKISEKDYNDILNGEIKASALNWSTFNAIRDGEALPSEHGRLIDADELYDYFIDGTEGYDCQTWNRIEIGDIIDNADTIIEANK